MWKPKTSFHVYFQDFQIQRKNIHLFWNHKFCFEVPVGHTGDEHIILERHEIDDERKKTVLDETTNFTVLLESYTNTCYLGSGVLISNNGQIWVITAAHCVANLETGNVKKMDVIRVR